MAPSRSLSNSFSGRDAALSAGVFASARGAELAARRDREGGEANGNFDRRGDSGDREYGDGGGDEDDDGDDDEEEVMTRVFEVELSGGSSPWATAFLECASEGDLATLAQLLDDGKVDLNDVDVDGFSALMIAAAEAQRDVAMELLRRGADVSIRTHEMRSTALHFAAKSGVADVVDAICTQDPQRVDAQNLDGDTPLVWACTEGRVEAVRVLLRHGANVSVVSHRAMSALICAVMLRESDGSDDERSDDHDDDDDAASDADRAEIVRLLLIKNPKLVNYQDRDGSTAMHLAASHGYLACIRALLEFGADITLRNAIGQTPLEEAEETGIEGAGGKCIEYLRAMWKKLEEEAAARMMAMLEMEESTTAAATSARSGGGKKSAKKKQKKAKQRRTSKATAASSSSSAVKEADGKAGVSSGDESSDEDDTVEKKATQGANAGSTGDDVEPAPRNGGGGSGEKGIGDDESPGKASHVPDGGVWTTVGRKHNQYLTQKAAAASAAAAQAGAQEEKAPNVHAAPTTPAATMPSDQRTASSATKKVTPVSPRSQHQRTTTPTPSTAASTAPTPMTTPASTPRSRDSAALMLNKVVPAKAKQSPDQRGSVSHATTAAVMPPAEYPPSLDFAPLPSRVSASLAASLPVGSPFSTFQNVHTTGRLYERYERLPEAAAVDRVRGSVIGSGATGGGGSSAYAASMWRGPQMTRSSVGSAFSLAPVAHDHPQQLQNQQGHVGSASTSTGIWRYVAPSMMVPQTHDRGASSLASRRWILSDRGDAHAPDAADPVLRLLSCGLCGELPNDNLQCGNHVQPFPPLPPVPGAGSCDDAARCLQLYCEPCILRAAGNADAPPFHCVKCRLPIQPQALQPNEFAQAQVAAFVLAARARTAHHLHQQHQRSALDEMRRLMDSTSERAPALAVDPSCLAPGASLSALSVGQLDALEEMHFVALQQITHARVENARSIERLRLEEWLKTQRDVFQFAPPSHPPH